MEGARPASESDLDVIAALAEWAIDELSEHRGGGIWSRFEARRRPTAGSLADEFAADDAELVVGTFDGIVLGYGAVHRAELHDGATIGVITDLYVLPDGRGVGIGEAMMDLIVRWCTQHGDVGIDSLALPGDRATKNFFETFGLKARSITVHRRLETP